MVPQQEERKISREDAKSQRKQRRQPILLPSSLASSLRLCVFAGDSSFLPPLRSSRLCPTRFAVLAGLVQRGGDALEDGIPVAAFGLAKQPHGGYQGESSRSRSQRQSGEKGMATQTSTPTPRPGGPPRYRWPPQVEVSQQSRRVGEVVLEFLARSRTANPGPEPALSWFRPTSPFWMLRRLTSGNWARGAKRVSATERWRSPLWVVLPCQTMPTRRPEIDSSSCFQCVTRLGLDAGRVRVRGWCPGWCPPGRGCSIADAEVAFGAHLPWAMTPVTPEQEVKSTARCGEHSMNTVAPRSWRRAA